VNSLRTTRRRFLVYCAFLTGAALVPLPMRLRAFNWVAAGSFELTPHEQAVLKAMANVVAPGGTVQTRLGPKAVPSAGDAGAVDFIDNLLNGTMLFAAGVRRPPYVLPGAPVFPASGAFRLWTVKHMGWFGDGPRPARPTDWPSELVRLQGLYRDGIAALDASAAPLTFEQLPGQAQEALLRRRQADETTGYEGQGEGGQPFFLTFLDHLAEACFADPVYGGNRGWVYWDMINFSGPSFVNAGGPGAGQGWTWQQLTGPFERA
jgi:gluconate 2-dehydrogenase subunit 3-like protein